MASCSRQQKRGLPDYSRQKARVRRHDKYVKKTAFGSSQSSLEYDQDLSATDGPLTIQEFRESLSRNEEDDEEITFMLRLPKTRRRDGSTHSRSRGRYNVSQDDSGQHSVKEETTTPARAISGKSKILVRSSSPDQLGASTEEISAYGYSPCSPRRAGRKPEVSVRDQIIEGREVINHQAFPMEGLLEGSESEQTDNSLSERASPFNSPRRIGGRPVQPQDHAIGPKQTQPSLPKVDISESEQTETSVSERSMTFESGSETSNSLSFASSYTSNSQSLSSSCTPGGMSKSHSAVGANRRSMKSIKMKSSRQRTEDEGADEGKLKRERPIFAGFGSGKHVRSYSIRSPSDSDESFTSFAQKYSRYSQPPVDPRAQRSDVDSTMDLNESFSSFASFAEDEEWAHESGSVLDKPLLEGGDDSADEEEELSIGDQSPDSVIVDLTSVSTSANSQSLSPRSSSKASKASSLSRERKSVFEVPLNDVQTSRSRKDETRISRHRREQTDGCSVGSGRSRVSNRSGGSWLSRRSAAQSTNSRFSRLEEYLNKNSTSARNLKDSSKEGGSKFSGDRKDDISTTSSLTMGTFRTHETKDSEWKKLSDVVESEEVPNPATIESSGINSNPFLAADRRKNVPVKNSFDSPKKTTKIWGPQVSQEIDSPLKSPSKSPLNSPPLKITPEKAGDSSLASSPTKTPSRSPGKLTLDRLSPFAAGKVSVPDVACISPQRGVTPSKSDESPLRRWTPSRTPTRASSTDAVLEGISEIICTPLASPRKPVRRKESPLSKQIGAASVNLTVEDTTVPSSPPYAEAVSENSTEKGRAGPKVEVFTKKFHKTPPPVNKGINLFNPSATSTGPKKQSLPRFVGDRVVAGSSPQKSAAVCKSKTLTEKDVVKAPDTPPTPAKPSKVQSYLRRFKEKNPESPRHDETRVSSMRNLEKDKKSVPEYALPEPQGGEAAQKSPGGKKWNTPGGDIVESQKNAASKPSETKSGNIQSNPPLSNSSDSRTGTVKSRKPSRPGPVASRLRIDQFLEKHNQDKVDEDVFREPVPSPWRPSSQCGRSRQRLTDSNSRASSMASSKCSTGSRRTSALSMFQPHRQVSVEYLPGHHSPTHASKGFVSAEIAEEDGSKLSLVEQRKRMFQTGAASKQQSTRSFQGVQRNVSKQQSTRSFQEFPRQASITSINEREEEDAPLRLPSASEISTRVSSWHVNALLDT